LTGNPRVKSLASGRSHLAAAGDGRTPQLNRSGQVGGGTAVVNQGGFRCPIKVLLSCLSALNSTVF